MKKYREWIGVFILSIVVSFLNILHVFYWALKTPPDKIFIGITHWYEDYFFYLSLLAQGAMGKWYLTNAYTLEKNPIGFNWLWNLLLGKLSLILSIPVWSVYDASIFIVSILYVLLLYRVLRQLFPDQREKRIGALLIALFSTNLGLLQKTSQGFSFIPITYFYAYTESLNRFGGVSHQIVQNILSLASIYIFAKLLVIAKRETKITKNFVILSTGNAIILSLLMTVSTFYVFTNLLIFCVSVLLLALLARSDLASSFIRHMVLGLFICLAPISILTVFQWQLLSHPFWQLVRQWEATQSPTSIQTFLLSAGFIVILIPFGLKSFLSKATPLRVLGAVYAFLPIGLYFFGFAKFTQTPSFRLLQPPAYVFFAAIAIEGIAVTTAFLRSRLSLKLNGKLFYGILSLFLIFQIPGLFIELRERINEYYLNSHLNFLDRDVYNGLMVLKNQTHDKNVLAVHTLESFVPVVSGHNVYEGHATLTMDYKTKIEKTIDFYTKKMTREEGKSFLDSNNIGYVLWESRFGNPKDISSYYTFLWVLYENPKITIFSIQ